MFCDVRGELKIVSTDPSDAPSLRFNYLSTPNDRKKWLEAVRTARHILSQPAFGAYDGGEPSPGPELETTDEGILDWVAWDAEPAPWKQS